ncbi:MAG: hypothetical protein KKB13_27500 [Chloroflexi bacterium]|nr:hypothetical protein [Chloroflexota bacterium]
MKRKRSSLLIVLVIVLTGGLAPAPVTPARAQVETTASSSGPGEHDPRQAIGDFVANAGGPVGAEEIVSFLNGDAETAAPSEYPFGPAAVFNPAATYLHIAAARLTDTKFVVAYRDLGNLGYGMAIMGQVSGTDITYGAEYVFNAATTQYESVAALSDTKFVVAYRDGDDLYGKARVGQVAGSVISYGSEVVFNAASTEYASVAALSDTKFVVAYRDSGSTYGVARVGQVTGTTISYGTAATFNSFDTSYVSVAALSATQFVVAFRDADFLDYGFSMVGQVTDKAISYGTIAQFNSASTFDVSVAALSETKFVVAYRDVGLGYGEARVGTVAGTAISYGSVYVFNDAATRLYHSGGVARLSDTTFIVGYENSDDDDGRVIVGSVSGDAITFGNQVSYNAGSASYDVTVVALSESKYVVAWDDESNFDYGTSKLGMLRPLSMVYLPLVVRNASAQ